jgi:hypothetical protein
MTTLTETIAMLDAPFVITNGRYSLTADAMSLRGQQPLYAGDDYVFQFTLVDSAGNPIDITGDSFTFTAKYSPAGATIVTKSGAIVDASAGQFSVTLEDVDVPGPELIHGFYDIQRTIAGSGLKVTLISGDIEWLPNLTA